MRIKPAIVIIVALLIVGGAIVMALFAMNGDPQPADAEPAEPSQASRTSPWVTDVESALKNAATAQESFATSSGGLYTAEFMELEDEGLQPTENVTIVIVHVSDMGYCLEAVHARLTNRVWHYTSDGGRPVEGACRLAP